MKFLITGGAGFIGHNVVSILESQGHECFVVDNQTDSTPPPPPTEPAPNNTKKIIIGLVVVGVIVGAYIGYKKGLFSGKATN